MLVKLDGSKPKNLKNLLVLLMRFAYMLDFLLCYMVASNCLVFLPSSFPSVDRKGLQQFGDYKCQT